MSTSDQHTLEALQSAWKFIDSQDEGIIDFEEWNNSIQRLNCGLTPKEIKTLFKLIDVDNSGHIDQSDFILAVNQHNNNSLAIILQSFTANICNGANAPKAENDDDEEMRKWHKVFESIFDGLSAISQEIWVKKMLSYNITNVSDEDLRLFHAVMDSQFRSYFDFDEFYETFTIQTLHHKEMDTLRDKLKNVLLPPPPKQTKKKKESKEMSVQTDKIHKAEIVSSIDVEIDDLERHIFEEEKYLEIMEVTDKLKKENNVLFEWQNANVWTEYQVINWLNEIGIKEAKYINMFAANKVNGYMLLNEFDESLQKLNINMDGSDVELIEKSILILKNTLSAKEEEETKQEQKEKEVGNDDLQFYKRKCQHLNQQLLKMKKIEEMFKKNRRETESKLKQLECNLYFGSLSQSHLIQKFDINQLFEIQNAYQKTLINVQHCIKSKVNSINAQK